MKTETMTDSKVSIILQGPLTLNTLLMINYHASKYETAVVAPRDSKNSEIIDEICEIIKTQKFKVSLFLYNPETEFENLQNRYYQIYSTYLGLQSSNSEFVLKFRCDEFYSNIDPLIEAMIMHPDRIVTTDIFFRQSTEYKYHISDHIIGGKTQTMIEGFEFALDVCKNKIDTEKYEMFNIENPRKEKLSVEQIITMSFLIFLSPKHSIKNHIDAMKNNFFIVSVKDLGLYMIKQNHKKEEYTDYSFFNEDTDVKDIEQYS